MHGRDVADITSQHPLLAQFLALMLLRVVVIVLVYHRAAAVMTELRPRHRRAFQIAALLFHTAPGPAGLFGKMHFPVALVLRLQVALTLLFIADVSVTVQGGRVNAVMVGAQQADSGAAPDFFDLLFLRTGRAKHRGLM